MGTKYFLNGNDWLFKEFIGEDWLWRNSHKPDTRDLRWWKNGSVPGTVQHDLWQLGEIPDPYLERNSLLCEWVPERTWVYKKTFFPPQECESSGVSKKIRLFFKGIDYEARIFLNGEELGRHQGMFTPAVFEVNGKLKFGEENLLAVVLEPAPHEQPQVGKTSLVRTSKARMNYWWDFCPRMIHQGIWDDVYLEVTGPVKIEEVFCRPQLEKSLKSATVSVAVGISAEYAIPCAMEVVLKYGPEETGRQTVNFSMEPGLKNMAVSFSVPNPHLWWPNGYGPQNQYIAEVRLIEHPGGRLYDQAETAFGIRSVELVPNENADPLARPYTFNVNGRKIYAKGWNWVPIDVMYGVPRPEKLRRLLTLAQRAQVNLLRVWGGGLIEKDLFYELCSKYGIMIWQEFIQSSSGIDNKPAEDPGFIEMMTSVAEHVIRAKRNFPALVIWCGGNELQGGPEAPLDDRDPVLGALRQVVERLDPDRHWLPTSPSGRFFSNSLENIAKCPSGLHDVHGPWEHQGLVRHYELYNQGTSLFHSEFGSEGMSNLKTIEKTIGPENRWPPEKENPVWFHRGAWWINAQMVREVFGPISNLETMVQASQILQAEGLRYALEANRRRKYQNSGSLPWQFNEPYPNAYCTAAVDYYARPKAAYYAVSQAYRPLTVTAKFGRQAIGGETCFNTELWVANSCDYDRQARLDAKILGAGGKVYRQLSKDFQLKANVNKVAEMEISLAELEEDLFILDLTICKADLAPVNSRYIFSRTHNLQPMLQLTKSVLEITKTVQKDTWEITLMNSKGPVALYIRLEDGRELDMPGYAYFDDNCFSLLPHETKKVGVDWSNVPENERKVEIYGLNTGKMILD